MSSPFAPDPATILGMPVHYSPAVKRGEVFIATDPASPTLGYAAKILLVRDWIEAKMLEFDHDLWWRETPKQTARRITNEVLVHHGFDPLPEEHAHA